MWMLQLFGRVLSHKKLTLYLKYLAWLTFWTIVNIYDVGYGSGERTHGVWPGRQDGVQRPHITVLSPYAKGS